MAIQGLSSPFLIRCLRSYSFPWGSIGKRKVYLYSQERREGSKCSWVDCTQPQPPLQQEHKSCYTCLCSSTYESPECVVIPMIRQSTGAGMQARAVENSKRTSWTTRSGKVLMSSRTSFNEPGWELGSHAKLMVKVSRVADENSKSLFHDICTHILWA